MDLARPKILTDSEGRKIVPSVVSLNENGELIVGEPAREMLLTHRSVPSIPSSA